MNGARSIFMRKGYWLTALAAIVLLAASPGTAQAQIEVTGPDEVTEGETATYTVTIKGYIQDDGQDTTATVTLATPSPDSDPAATAGEAEDISTSLGLVVTFDIPAHGGDTGDDPKFFSSSGVIRVQTLHDLDAEDDNFTLQFSMTNGGLREEDGSTEVDLDGDEPEGLSIEDDEDQEYNLTTDDDDAKEGDGTIMVTVTANPAHDDGSAMLSVQLDAPRSIASIMTPTTATVPPLNTGNRSEDITITLNGNDKNRDEDTITVSVYSGSAGNSELVDSLSIDIEDKDALPAVAMMVVDEDGKELDPQPTSVKEGDAIEVVVTVVDKDGDVIEAAEDLTVALRPTGTADSADYTLVGSSDIKMGAEMSGAIEIEVRGSDDDVGMESLMFDAVVSGDSANGPGTRPSPAVLSLYIEDATEKLITPKASEADYAALMAAIAAGGGDDGVNPGDTVTLMTSDLFDVMDGYTASYGVSVEGDSASASASGESVTINALMAGEAKITVTGTARMASSSLIPTQTVSNVAELTFPVMVVDTELVVTLSAEPMEVEAGGTTMITATANRAVTAGDGDVEIALAVVPEGAGTLDAESITIAMGDMSGSAMLTANESVTVVATGSGVSGLMQVAVTVTAAPVPEPENQISSKSQDEAYPVITAAIATGAGEDEMLTYGESFSLMASDLFDVMEGYAAVYAVEVDGDAVSASVSGDSVSVMAGAAGEAKVTITGTAKMAASSFDASQDATNVASITFPVTVAESAPEPVPALPLIAQWLLGLGLLGGGARQLFRRRRQG